jgi:tRNA A-37 threonylcarbamoyl transferase component Bud32
VSAPALPSLRDLPGPLVQLVEWVCKQFEEAWAAGRRPALEEGLREAPVEARGVLLVELLRVELAYRLRDGEVPVAAEYQARLPEEAALIDAAFAAAVAAGPRAGDRGTAGERGPASEGATVPPTGAWEAPPTVLPGAEEAAGEAAPPVLVPGYEVLGRLGKGGMGVVYKARHHTLGRTVALKMILHAEHAGADERHRFQAEAEAVASLQHPHIVQVFEVGEHGGLPYFSLEFCPGGNLEKQLDGTPWEGKRAAALIETLARAMHAAHQKGLIHRDLKPANVLLAEDGTPKITDFGLAKRLDQQGRTQTGAVVGTPSYMAPEQAGGRKDIGPAADIYALGAILYELLTGRPPFRAPTPLDTVLQVLSEDPVPVRRLQSTASRDLETICHKCLQKDPQRRYPSALELAADLRRWQASEPIRARRTTAAERAVKWVRRRRHCSWSAAWQRLPSSQGCSSAIG